jgi:uncharacterized protein
LIFFVFATAKTSLCQTNKSKNNIQPVDSIAEKLSLSRQIFWDSLPQPTGYVNDYEFLYTVREKAILDSIIADFDKTTTNQIMIITLDSTMTTSDGLDDLTFRIANRWGVGQKGKNNGVTIGISRDYRKMRIDVGYGIDGILTDDATKEIIDNFFIPDFKKADYFEGTLNGINAIIKKLSIIPAH